MTRPEDRVGEHSLRPPILSPAMWTVLLAGVAFAAAWPAMMIFPNEYDSCIFLWMGRRMLAGDLPYRDLWDNKTPLLYWVNGLAAATGRPGLAIYVLQSLAIAAGGGLLYGIARRMASECSGRIAGLAYVTLAGSPVTLMTGNLTEDWAAPFAVLAVYAMVRHAQAARRTLVWPLLSGLGLGVATSFRQPAILVAAALLALLPALWRAGRVTLRSIAAWILGFGLMPGAIFAWAAAAGVLPLMAEQCVRFNLVYGTTGSRPDWATWPEVARRLGLLIAGTWPWHLAAGLGLMGLLLSRRAARSGQPRASPPSSSGPAMPVALAPAQQEDADVIPFRRQPADSTEAGPPGSAVSQRPGIAGNLLSAGTWQAMVILWLLGSAASALPSLRFYNHHYYLALAPVGLLVGVFFEPLLGRPAGLTFLRRRLVGWAVALGLACLVAFHFDSQMARGLEQARAAQPVRQAAEFLGRVARAEERVFVFGWGRESDLLARAPRPCPTRHVMVLFYPELHSADQMLTQWRDEMLADPPDWLVCCDDMDLVADRFVGDRFWNRYWSRPPVRHFARQVHAHYRFLYEPAERFDRGRLIVYRRKAGIMVLAGPPPGRGEAIGALPTTDASGGHGGK